MRIFSNFKALPKFVLEFAPARRSLHSNNKPYGLAHLRADPESFVRGGPTWTAFFFF